MSSARPRRLRRVLVRLALALLAAELLLQLVRPETLDAVRDRTFHASSADADYITLQPLNFDPASGRPLMLFDPELFWRMAPERHGTWFLTPDVRTNALGLRGPPVPPPPAARDGRGPRRLLALGDSVTFGFRVAEAERWPDRLAARLSADGAPTIAVDAGVVGYASSQGAVLLPALLDAVRPDVVLACFGINDAIALDASDADYAALLRSPGERARRALRASQLACAAEGALAWARAELAADDGAGRRSVARYLHYPRLPPAREKAERVPETATLAHLDALRAACAEAGTAFVVVTAHVSADVASERAPDPALFERIARRFDAIEAWAAARGVPCVDAREALVQSGLPDARLLLDPFHPGPEGHELMAAEAARTLRAAGLAGAVADR